MDREVKRGGGWAASAEGERLERVYSRYARSRRRRRAWAADNPGNVAIRRELLREIEAEIGTGLASAEVLDVGCGGGWLLEALAESGAPPRRLAGVDLLGSRIDEARRRLPQARFEVADARRLPFEDARFDLVLMLTVLSSLPDRAAVGDALREARRVLRRGGTLLCYEPRLPTPLNRATRRIARAELETALGGDLGSRSLTVLPPLARRLGRAAPTLYPLLARIPPLRSHRLLVHVEAE